MGHAHTHIADKNYYLEQICALIACAAIGAVAIMMYTSGKVALILIPFFHQWVLYGGVSLLVIAVIRGATLWRQAGRIRLECDHEHGHDPHCQDEPANASDCGHEHSHNWMPVKYAFLMLPICLYLLELPNAAFSADWTGRHADRSTLEGPGHAVADKGAMRLGFGELSNAANNPDQRSYFEGHTVKLRGMFVKFGVDKECTLMRLKMNCCAADVVPMQVRIISEDKIGDFGRNDWVEVEGKVEFRKVSGKEKYYAVLLTDSSRIQKTEPDATPYE